MIAITTACSAFADMANENAEHFKRNSGLDVLVIHTNSNGFDAKLEIPNYYSGRIIFFDADYRLRRDIRSMIPTVFPDPEAFYGVAETCALYGKTGEFPFDDCSSLNIPACDYINTGFFACDTSHNVHRKVFSDARQIMAEKRNGLWSHISDRTEQTILNLALSKADTDLNLLPIEWNFFTMAFQRGWCDFPRDPIGIHAAGVVGAFHKRTHLNELQAVLDRV